MNDITNKIPELFAKLKLRDDAEVFEDGTIMDDTLVIMDDLTAMMGTNVGINQYLGPDITIVTNIVPELFEVTERTP